MKHQNEKIGLCKKKLSRREPKTAAAAAAAGMQELSTMMGAGSKEVRHVEFQKDMVRQENVKGGVL